MREPGSGVVHEVDKFYERYNGGIFALVGVALGILTIGVSLLLYIRVDPTFSIFTHYMSKLGGIPKGAPEGIQYPSATVFNVGMLFIVPIRLAFLISIVRLVHRMGANGWLALASLITGLISTTGSLMIALVPFSTNLYLHLMSALVYFIGATSFQLVFSITEFRTPGLPRILPVLSLLTLMVFSIFSYLLIRVEVLMVPGLAEPTIWEWALFPTLMTWLLAHGLFELSSRARACQVYYGVG